MAQAVKAIMAETGKAEKKIAAQGADVSEAIESAGKTVGKPATSIVETCGSPAHEAAQAGGLTMAQARERARLGLDNRMPKQREGSTAAILRRNVLTLFNLLNLLLALALLWAGSYRNLLFLGVVVSNTLIGLVQELRAKRVHDRLRLLCQGEVRTLRDGVQVKLAPAALVQGDVVVLGRGDQVPADARVLEGACHANESLLTGESDPIPKGTGDSLRSGSFLTEGTVTAQLTAVGPHSYACGLQMTARKVRRPRSELMESTRKLIRRVSLAIVPMGALLYWRQTAVLSLSPQDGVTRTVAAVLGMIPEGLILLTSMALAVGVIRLGRHKALVNELFGIETLAQTDVICMDKTGTLTSGAMAVRQVIPLGGAGEAHVRRCMAAFVRASGDNGPTQDALRAAFGGQEDTAALALEAVPFSSERKWAAVWFQEEALGTLVLGAPEQVLPAGSEALEQGRELAAQGFRVLALAGSQEALAGNALPEGLQALGFVCLRDQLRLQVRETVGYFGEQGVGLKVISGDHPLTVASVAEDAGLPDARQVVDLSGLERPLDYEALCEAYTVFGRANPQDKQELINALKRKGHGVAMIGDGVNDIPALKAADCSIAMAGGSDAAQQVAQITLLDGSFSAMPAILLEGRRVINNITRASALFLVKNIFSFLLTAALLALPYAYPFAPIQMSLIAAATIGIPSFALAMQPNRERVRGRFLSNVMIRALPGGLGICLLTLILCALHGPLGLSRPEVSTLCALAAGYTGLWVLLLTCLPLDMIRGVLVAAMTVLFFVGAFFFPSVFYFVPLSPPGLWAAGGMLVGAPLCLLSIMGLVKRLTGDGKACPIVLEEKPAEG